MSEVDRLSNSGLYPALPIADKRSSRNGNQPSPRDDKQPDKPPPGAANETASPRPPKSLIDEYA